jgi:hypothetical protein
VEAKTGFRVGRLGLRITMDLPEEPIDHGQVEVRVGVQERAAAIASGPLAFRAATYAATDAL